MCIRDRITAFGTGIHEDFDITKLRYNKIIIMTDADVDGAHIATLLLTFLYRFMPDLIKEGHVYLAQPPLYKVEKNKKVWYAYSDEELNKILTDIGRDGNNKIQRYKGLGEMDASQLWETTMDPEKRILLRVNKMCIRDSLYGVNTVSKAVSNKTTMDILQCILIEAYDDCIKLTANDTELGIETVIEGTIIEPGKIALEAKIFSEIIKKIPDNDVCIETDESGKTNIECEQIQCSICLLYTSRCV